eukprot:scaffold7548_cov126-Isochrysis_galbana.AAC.3
MPAMPAACVHTSIYLYTCCAAWAGGLLFSVLPHHADMLLRCAPACRVRVSWFGVRVRAVQSAERMPRVCGYESTWGIHQTGIWGVGAGMATLWKGAGRERLGAGGCEL